MRAKRLLFIAVPLLGAFVFFSFLMRAENGTYREAVLLVDRHMKNGALLADEIATEMRLKGLTVVKSSFDAEQLDHFLIANPDALFVTDSTLHSKYFPLQEVNVLLAYVAVTSRDGQAEALTGEEFDRLARGIDTGDGSPDEIRKKVLKKKLSVGIIPFRYLDLELKLLPVDGEFPSIEGIESGKYPRAYRISIYTTGESRAAGMAEQLSRMGIEGVFTVIAGGDIMLTRGIGTYLSLYGPGYPFDYIRPEIVAHDISFANLESPISRRGFRFQPDKGIYFKAEPEAIDGLKEAGFDILSLANNHSLDYGVDAIVDTMSLLRSAGIMYAGVGASREKAMEPAVFNVGGVTVAIVAYNDVYPSSVTEAGKSMVTLSFDESTLEREIKLLKELYDILIVSVHMGTEYIRQPEPEKVRRMRRLVELGADVVLGHHPHVVQDLEIYRGRVISYSLGNLIFDQNWSEETSQGLLLEIGFTGKKPVYCNTIPITIANAQARIVREHAVVSIKNSEPGP